MDEMSALALHDNSTCEDHCTQHIAFVSYMLQTVKVH